MLKRLASSVLLFLYALLLACGECASVTIQNSKPRTDVKKNIIDAHDGSLLFHNGTYYLYGTPYGNGTGSSPDQLVYSYAVYSSDNLQDWVMESTDLLPNRPAGIYYRAHVRYNKKTQRFVLYYCWRKAIKPYSAWPYGNNKYGGTGVAVSSSPTGPFRIYNANVTLAMPSEYRGDFSLFVDDDVDETAYIIGTAGSMQTMSIERLTPDYLGSTLQSTGTSWGENYPAEAPVLFKRNGLYIAMFDTNCGFCKQGSGAAVHVSNVSALGPFVHTGRNINRFANGTTIIKGQQAGVWQMESTLVWVADLWQSTPDGVKGHDLQYWGPIEFDSQGVPLPLKQVESWTID